MLKGISPLISFVMVIFLTVITIGIVIYFGIPTIEKAKESAILNEALGNVKKIGNTINEVATEGSGSLRTLNIKVSSGEYKINQKANKVEFFYEIKSNILKPGTFIEENGIILTSGASCKAYEENGSLILENEILKVILLKNGTRPSYDFINTSKLIKQIVFKENNFNITPSDSSIVLDDLKESSYGYGYTELVKEGTHLPKAEALIHLNTSFIVYDILYTLQSGADFLTIKIINAYYK